MSIVRRVLIWIGMASVLLATGGTSRAQMGYTAASIEWLVANSDVVVRASVDRIKTTPVVQVKDGVYRNPEVWKTVTLKVHETLKGDPTESLTFVERTLAADGIYEGWRDAGREQLWLLVRQEEDGRARLRPYGGGWSVIRLGPRRPVLRHRPPLRARPLGAAARLGARRQAAQRVCALDEGRPPAGAACAHRGNGRRRLRRAADAPARVRLQP